MEGAKYDSLQEFSLQLNEQDYFHWSCEFSKFSRSKGMWGYIKKKLD